MSLSRSIKRLTFLLLLFCLPFQLVSAAAIACLHASAEQQTAGLMTCHSSTGQANTINNEVDSSNPTECQKCALELLLLATETDTEKRAGTPLDPIIYRSPHAFKPATIYLPPLQRPPLSTTHI